MNYALIWDFGFWILDFEGRERIERPSKFQSLMFLCGINYMNYWHIYPFSIIDDESLKYSGP